MVLKEVLKPAVEWLIEMIVFHKVSWLIANQHMSQVHDQQSTVLLHLHDLWPGVGMVKLWDFRVFPGFNYIPQICISMYIHVYMNNEKKSFVYCIRVLVIYTNTCKSLQGFVGPQWADLVGPWLFLPSANFSDLPVIRCNDVGFRRRPVHTWRSLTRWSDIWLNPFHLLLGDVGAEKPWVFYIGLSRMMAPTFESDILGGDIFSCLIWHLLSDWKVPSASKFETISHQNSRCSKAAYPPWN